MDTYQKLLSWCQILPCENIHSLVQLYHTFSEKQAKAIPHKERLATLHAICLQISSDEKFDDASVAQSLCGIALKKRYMKFAMQSACRISLWLFSLFMKID
jgi:hypothetical protein